MLATQEYSVILVGTDGSDQARDAFKKAMAVALRNDAKIIIATVIENRLYGNMGYSLTNAELLQVETDSAEELLASYKKMALDRGLTSVETNLSFGSPKVLMAEDLPEKFGVDLIMVGQSGLSAVEKLMMGSVSSYIIRHAPCDVLVVRPNENE